MSFRYKSALLSLVSLVLAYGWYFSTIVGDTGAIDPAGRMRRLIGTIVVVTVIQIAGSIVLALTSRDRYAAMDEREAGFDRRATQTGYYLLLIGALVTMSLASFGRGGVAMADALLLAVVVAEAVRQTVFVVLHHRVA